jgi:large subunit ribosomal protein L31
MKQGIHPNYVECTVRCTCGNTWKTRSTKKEMTVDLCDKCHPFYTGQQKLVDTGGRVQRFADKFGGAAQARLDAAKAAKSAKAGKAAEEQAARKAAAEAKAAAKAKRAAEYEKRAAKAAAEAPAATAPVEEAPAEETATE